MVIRRVLLPAYLLGGAVALGIAYFVNSPYILTTGFAILASGAFGYLKPNYRNPIPTVAIQNQIPLIGFIAVLSLVALFYVNSGWERTFPYQVGIALWFSCLVTWVLLTGKTRTGVTLLLIGGIVHRALSYFSSNLLIGNDELFHGRIVAELSHSGFIEATQASGTKYAVAASFHILGAIVKTVTGLDIVASSFYYGPFLFSIIAVSALFGIGKSLYGEKEGFIASFLFILSEAALGWSIRIRPELLAFSLISIIFLLLERSGPRIKTKEGILILTVMFVVFLTHHFSGFILVLMLTLWATANSIRRRDFHADFFSLAIAGWIGLFLIFALTPVQTGSPSGFLGHIVMILSDFSPYAGTSEIATLMPRGYYVQGEDARTILHTSGWAVFLFLGLIGFYSADRHEIPPVHFGSVAFGLLILAGIGPLTGASFLLPHRVLLFISLPLAVLGSRGFVFAVNSPARDPLPRGFIISSLCLAFAFVFLMSGSVIGSVEDPYFEAPGAERWKVTESESRAYEFLNEKAASGLRLDSAPNPRNEYNVSTVDGLPITSDAKASMILKRWYRLDSKVAISTWNNGTPGRFEYTRDILFLSRGPSHTDLVRHYVKIGNNFHLLFGPFPLDKYFPYSSTVYENDCSIESGCLSLHLVHLDLVTIRE